MAVEQAGEAVPPSLHLSGHPPLHGHFKVRSGPQYRYQLVAKVGEGSFGKVILARCVEDRRMYVLKKVRLARQSKKQREATLGEMRILGSLRQVRGRRS